MEAQDITVLSSLKITQDIPNTFRDLFFLGIGRKIPKIWYKIYIMYKL